MRAAGGDEDGVKRVGRGDEQAIAPRAAEGQIGDHGGDPDAAEKRAVRRIALNAVLGARPHIALDVAANAVGHAGGNDGEDPRLLELAAVGHVEGPDVVWPFRVVAEA